MFLILKVRYDLTMVLEHASGRLPDSSIHLYTSQGENSARLPIPDHLDMLELVDMTLWILELANRPEVLHNLRDDCTRFANQIIVPVAGVFKVGECDPPLISQCPPDNHLC